jgi:2,3-bisphosphoglycerate-dependent phosphoglycerate mutase
MGYLILVRHGESRWNIANKFTGWVDVPLSEVGVNEALIAGKRLEGIQFDVAFTSKLKRAQETLLLILAKQDATGIFLHEKGKRKLWSHHKVKPKDHEISVYSNSKINERYYGDLQGLNKTAARKKFGKEKVFQWRRSFDVRPPNGESLKDVVKRSVPYFEKVIMAEVKKGKNVIVAAHGNSLRAIIKHIDKISEEEISSLELSYGYPIVYKYGRGKLVKDGGEHCFNRPVHWSHAKQYEDSSTKKKKTVKKK